METNDKNNKNKKNKKNNKDLRKVTVQDYCKFLDTKSPEVVWAAGHIREEDTDKCDHKIYIAYEKRCSQKLWKEAWSPEYRGYVGDFADWEAYSSVKESNGVFVLTKIDKNMPLTEAAGVKRIPSAVKTAEDLMKYVANKKDASIFFGIREEWRTRIMAIWAVTDESAEEYVAKRSHARVKKLAEKAEREYLRAKKEYDYWKGVLRKSERELAKVTGK